MKNILYLFLLFLFCYTISGQNFVTSKDSISAHKIIDTKIAEYRLLSSSNLVQATKKLLEMKMYCEKIHYKLGAMTSSMGLLISYYNIGDYKKTLEESRFVKKYAEDLHHFEYLSDVYRMRSNTYDELGLGNESFEELEKALEYSDKIQLRHVRLYKKALIYESYAGIYDKKRDTANIILYRKKSIAETQKIPNKNQLLMNAKYQNLAFQYADIGIIYSKLKMKDSADYYLNESLKILNNKKYNIYVNGRAILLNEMANYYISCKDYQKAILFARRAEALGKHLTMPYLRKDIYNTLFNSYAETGKEDSTKYYLKLYSSLTDSLNKSEKVSMMAPVKQIISDNEIENKTTIRNVIISSCILFVIIIGNGWIYLKRKHQIIHRRYEALISKINDEKELKAQSVEHEYLVNTKTKTSLTITDETTKSLIQKLNKFERSKKFLRKEISLTWLASNLGTNPKYLSEIIKTYRDKNFTNYINGLRINYIIKKLYEDPKYRKYKISYLAEECGYTTQRVFLNAFKNETGFTPSYFMKQLDAQDN
ncbi:helix-turn-helix domain-containing protein [Chryseobacterium aureum]|uniref:helix-turn-helix domain-containing protein n=1 Tax=Chryseobacterium aureum TaxID=2497456 RepID=UPI000F86F028|nr:helix-turn-helix domain-containing protein [Chryseobacterium aureum]